MKRALIACVLLVVSLAAATVLPVAADTAANGTQVYSIANGTMSMIVNSTPTAPDNGTEYYNDAERLLAEGSLQMAVEYFDKALSSDTTMLNESDALMYTYKDKAGALADLGKYDEAITTAQLGIQKFPKSLGLYNNLGYAYQKQGKYDEAVAAYDKALAINSSYLKGWINKGDALYKAGKYGDAVTAYEHALTLDPANADALANLDDAKAKAAEAAQTTTIMLGVILIVVIAAGVWYIWFRKTGDEKEPEKKNDK